MSEKALDSDIEELVKQKVKVQQPPEDVASTMYTMYYPRFSKMLDRLSLRQVKRLLRSLVDNNLQTKDYEHKDQFEKEAFIIGDRLLEAKYVMLFSTYLSGLDQIEQAANAEVAVDTNLLTDANVDANLTKDKENSSDEA